MRVLLDTHVILWALVSPKKIPAKTRTIIQSGETDVFFSAASIWEIAIKAALGRLSSTVNAAEIAHAAIESGFEELPVRSRSAAQVAALPMHHRDPFDRLLIAQALTEPARLFTVDRALLPYSDLVTII